MALYLENGGSNPRSDLQTLKQNLTSLRAKLLSWADSIHYDKPGKNLGGALPMMLTNTFSRVCVPSFRHQFSKLKYWQPFEICCRNTPFSRHFLAAGVQTYWILNSPLFSQLLLSLSKIRTNFVSEISLSLTHLFSK